MAAEQIASEAREYLLGLSDKPQAQSTTKFNQFTDNAIIGDRKRFKIQRKPDNNFVPRAHTRSSEAHWERKVKYFGRRR